MAFHEDPPVHPTPHVAPSVINHLTVIHRLAEELCPMALVETITGVVGAVTGVVCAIPVVIKWIKNR